MKLYTVLDKQVNTYNTPFFQPTDVHAVRIFKAEINRKEGGNMLAAYPSDFALYTVGEWDADIGLIEAHTPKLITEGKNAVTNT